MPRRRRGKVPKSIEQDSPSAPIQVSGGRLRPSGSSTPRSSHRPMSPAQASVSHSPIFHEVISDTSDEMEVSGGRLRPCGSSTPRSSHRPMSPAQASVSHSPIFNEVISDTSDEMEVSGGRLRPCGSSTPRSSHRPMSPAQASVSHSPIFHEVISDTSDEMEVSGGGLLPSGSSTPRSSHRPMSPAQASVSHSPIFNEVISDTSDEMEVSGGRLRPSGSSTPRSSHRPMSPAQASVSHSPIFNEVISDTSDEMEVSAGRSPEPSYTEPMFSHRSVSPAQASVFSSHGSRGHEVTSEEEVEVPIEELASVTPTTALNSSGDADNSSMSDLTMVAVRRRRHKKGPASCFKPEALATSLSSSLASVSLSHRGYEDTSDMLEESEIPCSQLPSSQVPSVYFPVDSDTDSILTDSSRDADISSVSSESSRSMSSLDYRLSTADPAHAAICPAYRVSPNAHYERTLNQVTLLGRVAAVPVKRGDPERLEFSVMTQNIDLLADGRRSLTTAWHRIQVFKATIKDKVVDVLQLNQGIHVLGRISYNSLEHGDEAESTKKETVIIADQINFVENAFALNEIKLIGRVTSDLMVCSPPHRIEFSLGTFYFEENERGEYIKSLCWHRMHVWNPSIRAYVLNNLNIGHKVHVVGRIIYPTIGHEVARTGTIIMVDRLSIFEDS